MFTPRDDQRISRQTPQDARPAQDAAPELDGQNVAAPGSDLRAQFLDNRQERAGARVALATAEPVASPSLLEAGAAALNGVTRKVESLVVDGAVEAYLSSHGISSEQSKAIADLASRIPAEQLKDLKVIIDKLSAASPEELAAWKEKGDISKLGISTEKLDKVADALFEAGLGYLKEKSSLTQAEVDGLRNLYRLNQAMAGSDGVFDRKDIASLSASLTTNDLKTLSEAQSLVMGTIMSQVQQEAYQTAHGIKNAHPDYQKAVSYQNFRFIFRNGPISTYVRQEARNGIALGNAMANQGAQQAVGQIAGNLSNDFPDIARAITALETRDALAKHLGEAQAVTHAERQKSYQFFQELGSKSPAQIFAPDAQGISLYDRAQEHFLRLNRADVESHISSSLKQYRDVQGEARRTLDGVNRFLTLAANQDLREGVTRGALESAQNAGVLVQRVVDKTMIAFNATRDEQGKHFQIPYTALSVIGEKMGSGQLSPIDGLKEIKKQAIETGQEIFLPTHSRDGRTDALVKKYVEQGILSPDNLRVRANQENFSVYEVNGREYLGYRAKDSQGKELFCYVDPTLRGGKSPFFIMPAQHQRAYQEALVLKPAEAAPVGQMTRNDLQQESYTVRVAQKYMPASTSIGEGTDPQTREAFLKENHGAAFRFKGIDYFGYVTKDNRLALVGPDGKPAFMQHSDQQAAFFAALVRDGRMTPELKGIAAFNSVPGPASGVAYAQPATSYHATNTQQQPSRRTQYRQPANQGNVRYYRG